MSCVSRDLTLEGVLDDPMIAAALRADRIDLRRFEALLRATARDLHDANRSSAPTLALRPESIRIVTTGSLPQW